MSDLVRVTRGVWRPAGQVASLAGRVAAVLAAYPDGTVASGRTAARLHGLWLPGDAQDERIEVTVHPDVPVPRDRSYNRRPGIRARRQVLRPDETTIVAGLPILTEARTWLELAAVLRPADLVALGDSALRGAATVTEMEELISRAVHRRGVVRARAVLPLLDARSRSRPESHMRYAVVSSGLPKPDVNRPIFDARGEWLFEPDLSYDDVRLALEYNGRDHAAVERMRSDITREVDAGQRGHWHTVTFGPVEVFNRPDQLAAYVRVLRRERARLVR